MHAISPLLSGVRGAENGTADILRRGTSTRATYYTDFEATAAVTPSAALQLDSNGRFVAYVNELVTVVCRDVSGNTILEFVAGDAAPAVEYQGASFTGENYETGAVGAGSGYATTVQAVLDKWGVSAGATDFDVAIGGVAYSLTSAFGLALGGVVYFNVKSSAYGAVGNGVTDDTTAITAAIAAATAAGGGVVYFPAGNYRTTSTLTLPDKVSMLGPGSRAALIGIDHATAPVVTVNSTSLAERQFIANLLFGALQNNNGAHISVTASQGLIIRDCQIGSTTGTNGSCISVAAVASTRVLIDNCRFTLTGSASSGIIVVGTAKRVAVRDCDFILPATFSGTPIWADHIDVSGCVFDGSATTSGTFSYYTAKSTTLDASVENCQFLASGGATATAFTLGTYVAASVFTEIGSVFGTSVTAYSYTCNVTTAGAQVQLKTRENRILYDTNSAATYTALVQQYGIIFVNSSRAGNVTLAHTGLPPAGSHFSIVVANTDGSGRDFTPGTSLWGPVQTIASGGIWAFQTTCVHLPAGTLYMVGGWGGKT